ncbi:NAD-dependent deacylase [Virgibacillus soli]|uniref:protein acetyllysine N-acetyltransferase n=1 Tax=Paracerasibacillus soli TaxID=480284 RepID=A0ABU5CTD1_9BACI|nr:NAD-dependent deacylase [Virgibacillus soli]MDY0409599.1 NAD-dependent deacylase [Virgibacillus soli]
MRDVVNEIKHANHLVIFTGAGMSTESGLPDFRSENRGLWEKFNPDELANVQALENNREEFVNFYRYRLQEIKKFQPHAGHRILAKWEEQGLVKGIITQNVDGFHHDAGSHHVMELHGTFRAFHCNDCHKDFDPEVFFQGKDICDTCGGTIRPGIVLFGEMLPENVFIKAEEETLQADVFIVFGSSLTVTPANMFPMLAQERGAKLIIVNRDPTPLDRYADYVIRDKSIKEVLEEWDTQIKNAT